jgi:hypothetical protein
MKAAMTRRENLHQRVDTLPEERLGDVLDYLDLLEDDDTLSPEEEEALARAEADFRQGRNVSWDEFKRTRGL